MSWWGYVERVTNGQTPAQIAAKVGGNLSPSTVSRWKTAAMIPSTDTIFAFANAFEVSAQEALVAAYLPMDKPEAKALVASISNKELLAEVERRMRDD